LFLNLPPLEKFTPHPTATHVKLAQFYLLPQVLVRKTAAHNSVRAH
jgi:hypothetical protein